MNSHRKSDPSSSPSSFSGFLLIHSQKNRASSLIRSSARLIHKVTAGSCRSSPSILSPPFGCLLFRPPPLSPFPSLSGWWNGSAVRMDNSTPSLYFSSPLVSASHARFPSTSVCLRGRACCLPSPPPVWVGDAASHFLVLSYSTVQCCMPPSPPPSSFPFYFLPAPPLLCSQSHFEVHICMHSYILPSCTLMHSNAQGGEMGKEGRGWVCVSTCTAVHAWKNWAVYVGHSRVLPSCLVTWETDFKDWDKETPLPSLLQTPQPFSQQFCVTGGHSV